MKTNSDVKMWICCNSDDSTKNHGALKEASEDGEVTWGKEKMTYKDIYSSFHPS